MKRTASIFVAWSLVTGCQAGNTDTGLSDTWTGTASSTASDETGTAETMTAGDGDGDSGASGDGETNATAGDGDGASSGADDAAGDGDGDSESAGDDDSSGDGDGDSESAGDDDSGTTTGDGDGESESTGDGDDGSSTSDTNGMADCAAPVEYIDCDGIPGDNFVTDPFQAIGLNCAGGDESNSIQVQNAIMNSNSSDAWRVISAFGTATTTANRYNEKLWAANLDAWTSPDDEMIPANTSSAVLMLSTGLISAANSVGVVVETPAGQLLNDGNGNQNLGALPAPLSAQMGSNNGAGGNPFNDCDGTNDCSDSLYNHWYVNGWDDPEDSIWMSFDVVVPDGTFGYVFDFAYFSSEWPDFIDTEYNDLFIAWQVSEVYTGNVTFVNDAPLTITSLDAANAFQYTNAAPQLADTGFEQAAGTGWFTARAAVEPGEMASITFLLTDMADDLLATSVLIDNFRWECEGCVPSEIDDCGLTPIPE